MNATSITTIIPPSITRQDRVLRSFLFKRLYLLCWTAFMTALLGCATQSSNTKKELSLGEATQMRYAMAEKLVEKGDYDRALPYLRQLLEENPKGAQVLHLLLGIVLREKGMYGAAELEFKAVIAVDPQNARAHAAWGILLDKQNKHQQAERHHRRAIKLYPHSGDYKNNLGFCLFLQRRYAEAKEILEDAIHQDPSLRRAFNNLGFVLGLEGDLQGAMQSFRQAGSSAMAYNNIGLIHELRGQPQAARRYYQRALKINPSYKPALRNLRVLQPEMTQESASMDAKTP